MSIKSILTLLLNAFTKLGKWLSRNKGALAVGGAFGGAAVAVVAQDQKKKAVNKAFKEGCELTAKAYEQKLREQADRFISEKNLVQQELEQYEQLMREYEMEIARLEMLEEQSKEEKAALKALIKQRGKLLKLRKVG